MTRPPEALPGRRLDAHHHLWSAARVERGDYPWMPTGGALRGDHLPEHLAPALEATGVGGTIVVQAAPSVEETRFLLELAHATDFVLGVAGWVALDRPEDAELLAELAADVYLRAVRTVSRTAWIEPVGLSVEKVVLDRAASMSISGTSQATMADADHARSSDSRRQSLVEPVGRERLRGLPARRSG